MHSLVQYRMIVGTCKPFLKRQSDTTIRHFQPSPYKNRLIVISILFNLKVTIILIFSKLLNMLSHTNGFFWTTMSSRVGGKHEMEMDTDRRQLRSKCGNCGYGVMDIGKLLKKVLHKYISAR